MTFFCHNKWVAKREGQSSQFGILYSAFIRPQTQTATAHLQTTWTVYFDGQGTQKLPCGKIPREGEEGYRLAHGLSVSLLNACDTDIRTWFSVSLLYACGKKSAYDSLWVFCMPVDRHQHTILCESFVCSWTDISIWFSVSLLYACGQTSAHDSLWIFCMFVDRHQHMILCESFVCLWTDISTRLSVSLFVYSGWTSTYDSP